MNRKSLMASTIPSEGNDDGTEDEEIARILRWAKSM